MRSTLFLLAWMLLALACTHKADDNAGLNQTPLAVVNVKEITLADTSNLVSAVHLYWTGSDADGFVKGFRISVNNADYGPLLTRTDSLFRFNLTVGNLTERISVRVVAIDEKNAQGAPAEIILPLRNTRPTALFNSGFLPKLDTALAVLSLPFTASDADGDNTLDSVFLRVNGGPWYPMVPTTSAVVLMPANVRQAGVQEANVYTLQKLSSNPVLQTARLQGLVVGGANVFEIKSRDIAGAVSDIGRILTTTNQDRPYYFRPVTSDLLVLDAYSGSPLPTPESIYNPTLARAYPQGYDKIDLWDGAGKNQQRLFTATMPLLLKQYSKVFWYSDYSRTVAGVATNRVDTTLLLSETFAPVFANYIRTAGNHLLFSSSFPVAAMRLPSTSPIFGLLPIDSITYASNAVRLGRGVEVVSRDPNYGNLHTLTRYQNGVVLFGVNTFFPNAQTDSLYNAPITYSSATPTFPTSRAVGGRFPKGAAKPSLIFFTMDLHILGGDISNPPNAAPPELTDFLTKVLTRDFN